ncbi:MAG: peptide chain release factor 2 [Geodermatophilaceae bacterium]|nr:peptide chain release factor 2 [Geodermatophilaceae bacterium]
MKKPCSSGWTASRPERRRRWCIRSRSLESHALCDEALNAWRANRAHDGALPFALTSKCQGVPANRLWFPTNSCRRSRRDCRRRDIAEESLNRRRVAWQPVAVDFETEHARLDTSLRSIEAVTDVNTLRHQLVELEKKASVPDLWNDPENAQAVTSRLAYLQQDLRRIEDLRSRLDDLAVMHELSVDEDDQAVKNEVARDLAKLHREIEALEIRTLLGGEYDARQALVTLRSEAGGVDAADWAQMLLRMYLRWAERHDYPTEVYDISYAEEAGIKSATFAVQVPYAYGTLSVEQGTHRLVRISPFDNQGRRQTSFAGVEVLPVVEQDDHVEIPENDIRVDVFRSSGPGGQSVNTTDSAVRLTHLPTGIVVSCQNEKSQIQNRAAAMRVLQARLLEVRRREQKAEMDALKTDGNSWGNQMRSYVLHPYQMVKDLRTEVETGNTTSVLDGEIDEFIEAGIRWRRGQETATV